MYQLPKANVRYFAFAFMKEIPGSTMLELILPRECQTISFTQSEDQRNQMVTTANVITNNPTVLTLGKTNHPLHHGFHMKI